ncbi:hypothetical protein B0O99DRAFT_603956 [Bisporella sp. PMI_857]|nr:hypothetical protein B0O99DRAFT_603956 [Bisporella sp. PMI_857]
MMPSETLFLVDTATGPAPLYRQVRDAYRQALFTRIAEGSLRPFVLPYHIWGFLIVFVYLCIPHTKNPWVYAARWPVLAIIIAFEISTIRTTSSWNSGAAYVAGLVSAFGVVYSTVWLILYRPQWDARRVERRDKRLNGGHDPAENGVLRGYDAALREYNKEANLDQENAQLRKRLSNGHVANGAAKEVSELPSTAELQENNRPAGMLLPAEDDDFEYYWQQYPDNLADRIPWVLDLTVNFRGPGWNWQIPPVPEMPLSIKAKLHEPAENVSSSQLSSVGLRQFTTRHKLYNREVPRFIIGYLFIDIFKTIMMKDPYFIFGPNSYALPSHLTNLSSLQVRLYRSALSMFAIMTAIEMALLFSPLGLCLLLGPRYLGLRGEPWYYPTNWGSFSNITNKGLNGLWGSWWHQIFRFIFAAPTNFLISNGYVKPRSWYAKLLALFFAFGISGSLHGSGSITQFPRTKPFHPPTFFALQALGIVLQTTCCNILHGRLKRVPTALRQFGNVVFTFGWLFLTADWIIDDFARGGVWLLEPIPFSPLRGMGFGMPGDGWWCWGDLGIYWHSGKHWWESGIAI